MASFLLQNGFFLLNDGSGRLVKGDLRVENGRIAKIAKKIAKTRGEKTTDLAGKLVIPGFVQTHVHLCQTLFRNLADDLELLDWLSQRIWPMESAHTEKSLYASARLGISELLAGGTTTILDMGTVRHTDAIFTAAEEMGIRALIGKCLMDSEHCPPGLHESTADALKENRELHARWHGKANGRLHYAPAPRFLISCTEKLMREVREFSEAENLHVHSHSSENKSEVAMIRKLFGKENIEQFHELKLTGPRLVLAHCIWLNDQEKKILSETQTRVSHCPSSNLKLASGLCEVPALKKQGVHVSLGADGAPCNNNLNMFLEMRLASLLQKPHHGPTAMPAREVFEMATIRGAEALGLEKEIGSLEPGKKADLVAISVNRPELATALDEKKPELAYSALAYAASPAAVSQTWVEGRSVYREGSYPGVKAAAIVEEALQQQKRLLARLRE